jgi:hypothetical protein
MGKLAAMGWWRRKGGRDEDEATGAGGRPAPPGRTADERYRAADVVAIPAGSGEALVYRRGSPASHLLPESAVDLLQRCTPFRTLDDHCRALIRDLHLDTSLHAPVRDELERLATLGLLTSHAQAWREAVAAHGAETEGMGPPISTVAIVTSDRPEAALRCVASVIAAVRRHDHEAAVVVSDDSRDPTHAARLRHEIGRLAADYLDLTHVGRAERDRLATALLRELGDDRELRETLHFTLFGSDGQITPGANRNVLLLHQAGKPFLSLDDDTLCRLAPAPGSEEGLALSSLPDPSQFWFYPDRDAALAAEWQEVDPLALHEGYLGRTAAACVAALADPAGLDLDQADDPLLRRMAAGGRVAVTTTGLAGDSGMASPAYYLILRGPGRDRLLADYPVNRDTRAVVRAVTRPTLSTSPFLMTPCVGLDTSRLLPPFLPVGRNEDGVFAQLLRTVAPDALVAHLPWAISHDPPEQRAFEVGALHLPLTALSTAQAVILALTAAPLTPGGDPATRLAHAGRVLQEMADLPDGDLLEWLYLQRLAQIGRHIAHLDESLRLYDGGPAAWMEDVTAAIATGREGLLRPEECLPAELGQPGERLAATRDLLHRFGLLLVAWPALFAAARRIRR